MELAERFWSRVDRRGDEECWPWMRGCNNNGYGVFYLLVGELGAAKCTAVLASRMAFFLHRGRWPDPQALHGCDNPPCCNPLFSERELHVHEGTQGTNLRQAYSRGRKPPPMVRSAGEWPTCRLTLQQATEIRDLYAAGALDQYQLAARFGVGQTTIGRIVRGESYRN